MKFNAALLVVLFGLGLSSCGGNSELGKLRDTRGGLVSYVEIEHYSWEYLDTVLTYAGVDIDAEVGVTLYKLDYNTVDVAGNPYVASGAVAIPDGNGLSALISYQHSTATKKSNVPSGNNDEALFIAAAFASSGFYVVSMPDYLGLGDGAGLHPYVHAASEASASMDMIRATRSFCAEIAQPLAQPLFLTGYSQGGHATMALTQALQNLNSSEFVITASGPGAGPYDLSDTELNFALQSPSADSSAFLSYVMVAYNPIYNLYTDPAVVWQGDYATKTPPLFNGTLDIDQVAAQLPTNPASLFQAAWITELTMSPTSPPQLALQANNLYNWKPMLPMRLYHARSDNVVSYQNSVKALQTFQANGSTSVELVDLGGNLTHVQGIEPAMTDARNWFDTLWSPPTVTSVRPSAP